MPMANKKKIDESDKVVNSWSHFEASLTSTVDTSAKHLYSQEKEDLKGRLIKLLHTFASQFEEEPRIDELKLRDVINVRLRAIRAAIDSECCEGGLFDAGLKHELRPLFEEKIKIGHTLYNIPDTSRLSAAGKETLKILSNRPDLPGLREWIEGFGLPEDDIKQWPRSADLYRARMVKRRAILLEKGMRNMVLHEADTTKINDRTMEDIDDQASSGLKRKREDDGNESALSSKKSKYGSNFQTGP